MAEKLSEKQCEICCTFFKLCLPFSSYISTHTNMPNQLAPGTMGILSSATPPRQQAKIAPKSLTAFPVCSRCAIYFYFFSQYFFSRKSTFSGRHCSKTGNAFLFWTPLLEDRKHSTFTVRPPLICMRQSPTTTT